jgi:hypothetical protein
VLTDKLQTLDRVLRERHSALYATLRPGVSCQSKSDVLRQWFAWKDGQEDGTTNLLFEWHRFIPFAEGQGELRSMRKAACTNPIRAAFLFTLGRPLLRSWPLLSDGSGAGYYFDTGRRTVLYRVEGDPDALFESFDGFVDYLIELSAVSADQQTFLEAEQSLLQRYASDAS